MTIQQVVLLVDDDSDDALLVRVGLMAARPDVRLVVVTDGLQAVRYLEGKEPYSARVLFPLPNLLLLDLMLPMLTGFQVLRWIRKQDGLKALPVVVLTDCVNQQDEEFCFELGANAYVHKPFGLEKMRTVVRQLAERWLKTEPKQGQVTSAWESSPDRKAA